MSHLKIFDDATAAPVCAESPVRPCGLRRGPLIALVLILTGWAFGIGFDSPTKSGVPVSIWDLSNPTRVRELGWSWLSGMAWESAYAFQGGLLAALLLGVGWRQPGWKRGAVRAVTGGLLLALLLTSGRSRGSDALCWFVPLTSAMVGIWVSLCWLSGRWARISLVPQVLVAGGVCAAVAVGLWQTVRDVDPIQTRGAELSPTEKRRLWELFRNDPAHSPVLFKDAVRLTEEDANRLLAWGFDLAQLPGAAQIKLEPSHWSGSAALPSPGDPTQQRYLNLRSQGRLAIVDGQLQFAIEQLQLGRLTVPGFLVGRLSRQLESLLNVDPDVRQMVSAIESLRVSAGEVNIVAPGGKLGTQLMPRLLAGSAAQPDVVPAVQAQLRYLIALTPRLPPGDARFEGFLRAAFLLARDRSHAGSEPLENRAAILALGILTGHHHVAEFVGPVLEGDARQQAIAEAGRATLRGRADWARHFFVSASLALLSTADLTDAIGLFKEEIDSDGGSGFSFADLLADRAGSRFALAATRDPDAARAMQARLAENLVIAELFPSADNLPEGIPEATLQVEYGGVGGKRYRLVENELNRRLDRCPALR